MTAGTQLLPGRLLPTSLPCTCSALPPLGVGAVSSAQAVAYPLAAPQFPGSPPPSPHPTFVTTGRCPSRGTQSPLPISIPLPCGGLLQAQCPRTGVGGHLAWGLTFSSPALALLVWLRWAGLPSLAHFFMAYLSSCFVASSKERKYSRKGAGNSAPSESRSSGSQGGTGAAGPGPAQAQGMVSMALACDS